MNQPISIPPATLEKLAQPATPGSRHAQIVEIAVSLVSVGLSSEAVFAQLRPKYGSDLPDSEIRSVIDWAETTVGNRRILDRSAGCRTGFGRSKGRSPRNSIEIGSDRSIDPVSAVTGFLDGFVCEDVDLWERSPIRLPERFETDASVLISALFEPREFVNVVSDFRYLAGKGNPTGYGETVSREDWLCRFVRGDLPKGRAGVWVRPNPMDGKGVSDTNVSAFRNLLIEFDRLEIRWQIPFLARLRLPISALISSGGRSIHAWVRVDAPNVVGFREKADWIFRALAPYGLDTANRNPSRLSRLPGVYREIGGSGDNRQRLLYLNPEPNEGGIFR